MPLTMGGWLARRCVANWLTAEGTVARGARGLPGAATLAFAGVGRPLTAGLPAPAGCEPFRPVAGVAPGLTTGLMGGLIIAGALATGLPTTIGLPAGVLIGLGRGFPCAWGVGLGAGLAGVLATGLAGRRGAGDALATGFTAGRADAFSAGRLGLGTGLVSRAAVTGRATTPRSGFAFDEGAATDREAGFPLAMTGSSSCRWAERTLPGVKNPPADQTTDPILQYNRRVCAGSPSAILPLPPRPPVLPPGPGRYSGPEKTAES